MYGYTHRPTAKTINAQYSTQKLYSGTESLRKLSVGRGAKVRRGKRKATHAVVKKRQKRREK